MVKSYQLFESKTRTFRNLISLLILMLLLLIIIFNLNIEYKIVNNLLITILWIIDISLFVKIIFLIKELADKEATLLINRRGIYISSKISKIGMIKHEEISNCEIAYTEVKKGFRFRLQKCLRITYKKEGYGYWNTIDIPIGELEKDPSVIPLILKNFDVVVYF